jgi:hypothetical protein
MQHESTICRYRMRPGSFEQEKHRLLTGLYAVYLIALVTVLMIGLRNLEFTPGPHFVISLLVVTVSAVFTVSIGFWSIFRSLRLRRRDWDSFELTLTEGRILQAMDAHTDLVLLRSDVTGFDETKGRGFFIKTDDGHCFIYVPAELDGYEDLKQRLSEWRAFPRPRGREPMWRSPFFVGSTCLLACCMLWISEKRQYVVAAAFVLTVFLLSTFIAVLRSPRSSAGMKRMSWIYLAVALFALVRLFSVFRIPE